MGQYLPIFALLVVATLFAAISLVASRLLAPRNSTAAKRAPYECGIVPSQDPPERFPVRFYLVAMSFIVFDIEIIFLYPWAVIYRNLGAYGLIAIVVFSLPIFVSLAYEFSQGALDWGPSKQNRVRTDDDGRASRHLDHGPPGRPRRQRTTNRGRMRHEETVELRPAWPGNAE